MEQFVHGSMLEPYFRYLRLKAERASDSNQMRLSTPVQAHSLLGTHNVPGFKNVFEMTSRRMSLKFKGIPNVGDIIPTAASSYIDTLHADEACLARIALRCVIPSTRSDIAHYLSIHEDDAHSMLVALRHKGVLREASVSGKYILSILGAQPPTGSPEFIQLLPRLAVVGWMDAHGIDESSIDSEARDYFTIIDNVRPVEGKETKDIVVFDLLRAPEASPNIDPLQKGQLAYLFEKVYYSPIHEAALFATLAMPQTKDEVRDSDCAKPVNQILSDVWSKSQMYRFIDKDYRTTAYGERVIDTLSGTPLSSYRHLENLDMYHAIGDIRWENPIAYKEEFMRLVYSGLLYKILRADCGEPRAAAMVADAENVMFFLESLHKDSFYQPAILADKLGIDNTAAKNAYATAFRYGACGISTTSHPHLYKPVRKATKRRGRVKR